MPVVIKMKGLPFEATARDIMLFFDGLTLHEQDIHLAAYKDGKASGIAFAAFQIDDDARKAMYRTGKYMGKRYVELFLSSVSEMEMVLYNGVPEPKNKKVPQPPQLSQGQGSMNPSIVDSYPSGGMSLNRVNPTARRSRSRSPRNRPTSTSLGIQESRREDSRRRDGGRLGQLGAFERRSGLEEYVRQAESEKNSRSERYDGDERSRERGRSPRSTRPKERGDIHVMNDRARYSKSEMGYKGETSRRGGTQREYSRDRIRGHESDSSRESDCSREKSTCCRLFGLPFSASKRDVETFFKGLEIHSIKILLNHTGRFAGKNTGEAYVDFKSISDCVQALKRNEQYIGNRYIELRRVSRKEMTKELEQSKEEWIENETKSKDLEERHRSRPSKPVTGGACLDNRYPISDLAVATYGPEINPPLEMTSDKGPRELPQDIQSLGHQLANACLPNGNMDVTQALETLSALALTANINADDIKSNCVIGIRNLPSTITAEEIVDFFYGFRILSDSIRIHYLSPGRSSGDAMITFPSSVEAYAAIEQLNFKPVGKRKIQLFLV